MPLAIQTIKKPADLNDADALTSFCDAVNNGEVAVRTKTIGLNK